MLIFHHIPKTAGTSFVGLLQRNYSPEELFLSHPDKGSPSAWWRAWYRSLDDAQRRALKCVASHSANRLIPVLLEEGVPFEALTLLRDPVDRCLSLYYFVLELAREGEGQGGGRAGRLLVDKGWSLDDLYRHADDPGAAETNDLLNGFFNGQARSLLRPFGVSLDYAAHPPTAAARAQLDAALQHYDVGLVEEYQRTIDRWAARFGWRHVSYEAKNVTRSRKEAPAVSAETVARIRAYNQLDCALYDSFSAAARRR